MLLGGVGRRRVGEETGKFWLSQACPSLRVMVGEEWVEVLRRLTPPKLRTQCEKVVESLKLVYISTDDVMRAVTEDESDEIGQQVHLMGEWP